MSKNLTFKLILDGDSKGLVAAAKQSEDVTKKVFEAIKSESDKVRQVAESSSKAIGNIIPKGTTELADKLTQSLTSATGIIQDAGDNAKSTAGNFTDFGNKAEKALGQLKSDLAEAKRNLEAFSRTDATPADIAIAQSQVDQLEKEVRQADQAFNDFHAEVGRANTNLKETDNAAQTAQKGIAGLKTGYTALAGAMAALGVGLGIRELAETADAYTNLSVRINIATSEGGNFQQAMAGVHQVALMTNSTLGATADLFTRLNTVGKDMGMTQKQALDLTKTVTQAIQVGGGSAQASEAAITQFIQAMQGGVLRGEEFNSIMENGYGLAEALAKGLGVTTGELRKMAEAGELTASRVVRAIGSQSDEIQKLYNQFPTTISNALQRIGTSWDILIGKMDQANGASATIADWLVALADNIHIVENILNDLGEGFVWVGDQLKNIDPQTIEALKSTLVTAYEAIKQLGATMGETFVVTLDLLNDALGVVLNFGNGVDEATSKTNGFTKVVQVLNVALGFVSDGFTGIGVAVNLFVGMLYDLSAAWVNLVSKFSWGGVKTQAIADMEALANKAQEYYDRASKGAMDFQSKGMAAYSEISKTAEQKNDETLANAQATMEQLLALNQNEVGAKQATEDEKLKAVQAYAEAAVAANKGVMDGVMQADLITKGYIVTIDEAGKVSVQAGVSAAQAAENAKVKEEALKVAKENVKKADEEYLAYQKQAAIERAALEQQIEQAKRTGDLNALASAQTSLAGIDTKEAELANNRTTRINELNQLNSGAGQVVEGAAVRARKAATALGIDLDIALGRVSEKFAADQVHLDNYANGFDELGLKGEQATNALYAGWEKWVAGAKSQVELDAAKAKLQSFGEQGKLSTSQVEMGLQAIKRASQELPDALSPVEEAMKRLGIQSKEQLKLAAEDALTDLETIMKSGEATQEGLQQAYEKTIRLAEASGNAQVIAAANAKAAYLGLEVQLDATGKATVSKLGEIQQAAIATQRTMSQVSRAETPSNPTGVSDGLAGQDFWEEFKAERAKINEATKARMALVNGKGGGNFSQLAVNPAVSAMAPSVEPVDINTEPLEATSFGTVQVDLRTDSGTKPVQVMAGSEQNLLDALAEMKKRS